MLATTPMAKTLASMFPLTNDEKENSPIFLGEKAGARPKTSSSSLRPSLGEIHNDSTPPRAKHRSVTPTIERVRIKEDQKRRHKGQLKMHLTAIGKLRLKYSALKRSQVAIQRGPPEAVAKFDDLVAACKVRETNLED